MRRMIRKLGGMFVPIIFCTALIFTASMSLDLTDDLQGNARVCLLYTSCCQGFPEVHL